MTIKTPPVNITLTERVSFVQVTLRLVPLDTGRKLNVHKAFRIHPGRLRKVFCTLNSRPAPKGYVKVDGLIAFIDYGKVHRLIAFIGFRLIVVNHFRKKVHHRCLIGSEIRL